LKLIHTMKATLKVPTELEITHVRIAAAVNYDEEEIPNDFPGRKGEMWHAVINVDTGVIRDWPTGRAEKMHLTVKDCGSYYLMAEGREVSRIESDYVPHGLIPGSYGDVIELNIDSTGRVTNWPKHPNLSRFPGFEEEE
jgi:hypothetical protein